ncbi:MAG: hypothetical protein QUV02_13035 [Maricaulis sp.]|uniref:hypothetical protein n=1 Tax=Maricaulis sp. TaxID=1486257 RepID=UPI00262615C9|nr:hypothetical protein [Maricaulis sp.]MDM7985366.1 hypothetical protein [Maricaulis sp.]
MADVSVYRDADWIWNQSRNNPTVNEDILSFCSQSPHLVDFAYRLADHGHVFVGQVVRLSAYTLADIAGGQRELADQLRLRLQRDGLDSGMYLDGWTPPPDISDDVGE